MITATFSLLFTDKILRFAQDDKKKTKNKISRILRKNPAYAALY